MRLQDANTFLRWRNTIRDNLDSDALNQCRESVQNHQRVDGGFSGRSRSSDIYYSFFALTSLTLLGETKFPKEIDSYLKSFEEGTELDLVHACCLLRCRDLLRLSGTPAFLQRHLSRSVIAENILRRGQAPLVEHIGALMKKSSSIYDWYLGLSSLAMEPRIDTVSDLLSAGRCPDHGYGSPGSEKGTTTVTAAAISLAHTAGVETMTAIEWLLAQKCGGSGFRANPEAPIPDLLSTASAVNALSFAGYDISAISADVMDFAESCWGQGGQFCASPCDPTEDPEYTFYGLLTVAVLLD